MKLAILQRSWLKTIWQRMFGTQMLLSTQTRSKEKADSQNQNLKKKLAQNHRTWKNLNSWENSTNCLVPTTKGRLNNADSHYNLSSRFLFFINSKSARFTNIISMCWKLYYLFIDIWYFSNSSVLIKSNRVVIKTSFFNVLIWGVISTSIPDKKIQYLLYSCFWVLLWSV